MSRVACETLCTTGVAVLAGEITTRALVDYPDIARQVIRDVGYTSDDDGHLCRHVPHLSRRCTASRATSPWASTVTAPATRG